MYSTDEPVILENFLRHCAKGSYNNIKVLRFIPNFILQTGSSINKSKDNKPADPNNKPTGISHGKFLEHRKIKKERCLQSIIQTKQIDVVVSFSSYCQKIIWIHWVMVITLP